jgi:hypothetical protein
MTKVMRLMPHRTFTIETRLTPVEVHARLSGAVEPAPTFGLRSQGKPFIGTVNGTSFDVLRNVRGRNSFRPRVRGIITSAGRGSKLTGSMRVHEIVMVFIGFFVALAGTAAVWSSARWWRRRTSSSGESGHSNIACVGLARFVA